MTFNKRTTSLRVLVIGIGNPGRQDDGLGAACVEKISAMGLPGVRCDADNQLNLEDAQACSAHDVVVFADAADALDGPFRLSPISPSPRFTMSSHSLPPEAVLAICETLYGKCPRAYLLAIRGHLWGIGEGLSRKAADDLEAAVDALVGLLESLSGGRNGRKSPERKKVEPCPRKKSSS